MLIETFQEGSYAVKFHIHLYLHNLDYKTFWPV